MDCRDRQLGGDTSGCLRKQRLVIGVNHGDDLGRLTPCREKFERVGNDGPATDPAILLWAFDGCAGALAPACGHHDNSDRYRLLLMHLRHKSPKSRISGGALTAWRT